MEKEYREFVNEVQANVSEMAGYNITAELTDADNGPKTEDRIIVDLPSSSGMKETLRIPISSFYKEYENGCGIADISEKIGHMIIDFFLDSVQERWQCIHDYSEARKKLCVRLVNADRIRDKDNKVYRLISGGDIAEEVCLYFGETKEGSIRTAAVTRGLISEWGMEGKEDEVTEEAIANTGRLFHPRTFSLEKMFFAGPDYTGEDISECSDETLNAPYGICLSTDIRTNGASAIIMPGVAEMLSKRLGSGLYAVPTSAHEMMIHSDTLYSPDMLKSLMVDTINEATVEDDVLTKKYIIHYDPATAEFTCV